MSTDALITLSVVILMVIALITEIYAPDLILFVTLTVLLLAGVITPKEAVAGFSNTGMLTVAILFVVAYAAQSSGILDVFSNRVMGNGKGLRRSLLRMMAPVYLLSAFLNNTPIVAMFTPAVRDWATRHGFSPSKFLIPLSYASIFGGACTLIGTSTNLVVDGLLQTTVHRSLGMFDLAWVGVPCAASGILYLVFHGYRVLPDNRDLADKMQEDCKKYLSDLVVQEGSPIVGRTIEQAGLRNLNGLFLFKIVRDDEVISPVRPTEMLCARDQLFFTGLIESLVELQKMPGLTSGHDGSHYDELCSRDRSKITEAVVSRSFPTLGKTIRESNFRGRYDAVVLAVHRHGERIHSQIGHIVLQPGDTLLLLTGDDFFKRWGRSRDFYLISNVHELTAVNRKKVILSTLALVGMVLFAALGVMNIFQAACLSASLLLLSKCITIVEARRSIELNVLIVIACALGISTALQKTGAAEYIASQIIDLVKNFGPVGLLAAIYFLTTLFTEVITNNAAAALVFPVGIAAAQQIGADPLPFAIAIAIAASASFATPFGYQTNLIVYGPGQYRFKDFLRIGLPLNLIFMGIALIFIPLHWNL
ncbi:MAG: anion permease [Desulfuromonadaceae bacterium]|nr:anion permease [Desulfuromonadaceae bacterium]